MTLEQYNVAVKQILAEQQEIATATGQLAMSGQANPANPQFSQIMTKQCITALLASRKDGRILIFASVRLDRLLLHRPGTR